MSMRSLKSFIQHNLLVLTILLYAQINLAQNQCLQLFTHPKSIAVSLNAVEQLLLWEQTSNQARWAKPTQSVQLDYVNINANDIFIRSESYTPENILSYFKSESAVRWIKHPLNTSQEVPYLSQNPEGQKTAFYSASRSMFTKITGALFSFKLPTNHPHPKSIAQPEKADLNNDSIISMRRSKHIREYDEVFERDSSLYVLTEVISVASKMGNAFSVRDLRPLQDGNYYLPAFSIPYAGREIAKINNADFNNFWQIHFGSALGRAKAQLLIRYGLQMKTPNAQNWLVQLDKYLKPTGRIFMRDVADSNYVEFIARHNGSEKQLNEDKKSGYSTSDNLIPNWENSAWQMDEGGISRQVLSNWGSEHNQAYIKTIREAFNITTELYSVVMLAHYLKNNPEASVLIKKYRDNKISESKGMQFKEVI